MSASYPSGASSSPSCSSAGNTSSPTGSTPVPDGAVRTDPAHPSGYLITSDAGTPLEPDDISKFMSGVRERVSLDIKRFHGLRRVFTTLLTKAGVHDRVTMEMAGHADLDMTHYYQDPMVSQKRDAAQALDRLLRDL